MSMKIIQPKQKQLLEYLLEMEISIANFARDVSYSRTHISQVCHMRTAAGKELINLIYEKTNGRVDLR